MADVNKVRNRVSYERFLNVAKEIKKSCKTENVKTENVLNLIHEILDNYNAFGSATNSRYVKESINQVIADIKAGRV